MEEVKTNLPAVITPQSVQLKINQELVEKKHNIATLQEQAIKLVDNEDYLQQMKVVLENCDLIDKEAEKIHKIGKAPYWDGGKAWDNGLKLITSQTEAVRNVWKPKYQKHLDNIATRDRLQKLKAAQDEAIRKGIENNIIEFSNRIIKAVTSKDLTAVESLINLEKSPSGGKKYGEFHALAIERFDTVLLPILKDQKEKVKKIEKLNAELKAAEDNNDPDKMDQIDAQINELSDVVLQNNAELSDAVLNQGFFPVVEAQEVFPGQRVKRTNFRFEIADEEIALKKARDLLDFSINKEKAKEVLEELKKAKAFDDKDEVIVNGIRYIADKVREAL